MPSKPTSQDFRIHFDRNNALRMTCQNANCEQEQKGWISVLNVQGDEKHAAAARLLENDSGRKYLKLDPDTAVEWCDAHGADYGVTLTPAFHNLISATPRGMVIYLFPPGQPCFKRHLDREVVFAHRKGDDTRIHVNPLDWNEHMNIEADRINRVRQAG